MRIIETERLTLREIDETDAVFVHELLTDADFVAMIGNRGVATLEDAERAIDEKYRAAYAEHGFGMWLVESRADGTKLGMAGLVRRDGLDHVDVGYGFLPVGRGRGYATEAVRAVLDWAAARGIAPVVAIVNEENAPSRAILGRCGLVPDRTLRLPGATRDVMLYIPADPTPKVTA
ncbi:GNAT family N-acetyltransferase [Sphingomonas floccifaciens]|uniref:GNAT family N-acetyltransferase n=1 Tax=Sphingomonas floccifaciens TaxID=1844115 RepID=A0ABW4N9N4_9SPHN